MNVERTDFGLGVKKMTQGFMDVLELLAVIALGFFFGFPETEGEHAIALGRCALCAGY